MPGEQSIGYIPDDTEANISEDIRPDVKVWSHRGMRFFSRPITDASRLPYAALRKAKWMPKKPDTSKAGTQQNSRNNLRRTVGTSTSHPKIGAGPQKVTFDNLPNDVLVLICEYLQANPRDLAMFANTCRKVLGRVVTHPDVIKQAEGQTPLTFYPLLQTISAIERKARQLVAEEMVRLQDNSRESQITRAVFDCEIDDSFAAAVARGERQIPEADMSRADDHLQECDRLLDTRRIPALILGKNINNLNKEKFPVSCKFATFASLVALTALFGSIAFLTLIIDTSSSDGKSQGMSNFDIVAMMIAAIMTPIILTFVGVIVCGCRRNALQERQNIYGALANHELNSPFDDIRTALLENNDSDPENPQVVELDDLDPEANPSNDDIGDDAEDRFTIDLDSDLGSDRPGAGAGADAGVSSLRPGSRK